MEELLAFLGFSAGAVAAVKIGQSLRGGVRSAAVDAVRAGFKIARAAQRARNGMSRVVDEAVLEARKRNASK